MSESAPKIDDDACRMFQHAAELAGRKWNAAIMMSLTQGAERFTEIRNQVQGLSDRMLSARLRELEQAQLVERRVVPTTPVQVQYLLTPAGTELMSVLRPLVSWAFRWDTSACPEKSSLRE